MSDRNNMNDRNYIHPAQKRQEEHEKRKGKKKKRRGLLWLLLLLLLLGFGLGLGFGMGWFDGKGKDSGSTGTSADSTASAAESIAEESSQDESSEAPKTPVRVKVSGSTYIYNDSIRTLEQLKTDLSLLDKSAVIIEIADDNGVANAIQSLHELLGEIGLPYSDVPFGTSDSSSTANVTTTVSTSAEPAVTESTAPVV